MAEPYVAGQGDCISTIAAQYGFADWRTIWDHPRNAALRERRANANQLLPGDVVFVPDPDVPEHSRTTDAVHEFRVRIPNVRLRLRMVDAAGRPYAQAKYLVEASLSAASPPVASKEGRVPSDGRIELQVPALARYGLVRLSPKGRKDNEALTWRLQIGHLAPPDEPSGAEARMRNLGLSAMNRSGGTAAALSSIIGAVQEAAGLPRTCQIDLATRRKLEAWHDEAGSR
jgi:hypothetical protein